MSRPRCLEGPVGRVLVVGDLVADVRVVCSRPLARGEEIEGRVTLAGGGSAANQASWLAALGAEVTLVARVGDDALGAALIEQLENGRIELRVARDPRWTTGTVAALVEPGGERSLVTSRGANAHLRMSDVAEDCWRGAGLLLLTGYCFGTPEIAPTGRALVSEAGRRRIPIALDPASARLISTYPGRERFLQWTAGAAWAFPNSAEARALARAASDEEAIERLLAHYEGVAITRGAEGCLLASRERPAAASLPVRGAHHPVDTTGAGDAFAAGFLYSWMRGHTDEEAARAGLHLAAEAVAIQGARPPNAGLFTIERAP